MKRYGHKKRPLIERAILFVLLIGVSVIFVTQFENLRALSIGLSSSPEEILELIEQNDEKLKSEYGYSEKAGETQGGVSEDEIIGRHIAGLYSLKLEYIQKLGQLKDAAINEYSLAGGELKKIRAIADDYILQAAVLEQECDRKVLDIIKALKDELSQNGFDVSVADAAQKAYIEEKALKKAYYIALLEDALKG